MKRIAWASRIQSCTWPTIKNKILNPKKNGFTHTASHTLPYKNIRELLHYIKEDERLREEIYRLIFDEDDVISYQALWVCTHFSKPEVEWLTLKQDELIDAALYLPAFGKTKDVTEPKLCQQQLADPPRVDFTGFLYGTNGIKARTGRSAVSLHQTCLSTDPAPSPNFTTRIAYHAGNYGTRTTGSRYSFSEKKIH